MYTITKYVTGFSFKLLILYNLRTIQVRRSSQNATIFEGSFK